jgi:transposase-like protein
MHGLNPKNETLGKRHTVQGKELQVAKKRVGRYPKEFRRMAVERLKKCDHIVALSRELGVHRRLLYKWRDQLDPAEVPEESPPQNSRESTLRKEVSQLKRLLADKAVEVDFFRGAFRFPTHVSTQTSSSAHAQIVIGVLWFDRPE